MNIKKNFRGEINHKLGIAAIGLAFFEIFLVLNPMWSLSLMPNGDVLTLFVMLFSPITTLFVLLYVLQFLKFSWFDKWCFTRGYLIGLFISIVPILMGSFISNFPSSIFRVFPIRHLHDLIIKIVNVSGDYHGFGGGIILSVIGELFILLIILPILFGLISSLIFNRPKGTRPE
jgi:hypothetical protein